MVSLLLLCLLLGLLCLANCSFAGIAWLGLRAWPGRVWRVVLARSSKAIGGLWTFRLWRALPAPTARGRASTRCRRAETRRMRCAGPAAGAVLAGSTSLGRAGACGTCSARRALASARWTIGGARPRLVLGSRGTTRCCKKFAGRASMRACVPLARSSSSGARAWAFSLRSARRALLWLAGVRGTRTWAGAGAFRTTRASISRGAGLDGTWTSRRGWRTGCARPARTALGLGWPRWCRARRTRILSAWARRAGLGLVLVLDGTSACLGLGGTRLASATPAR